MKKASRILVLRGETIRTLAKLELSQVAAGASSGQCAIVRLADSGDFHCPNQPAIVTSIYR